SLASVGTLLARLGL
ncbi:hypothetical protein, partial [Xanthomonas oryzae]